MIADFAGMLPIRDPILLPDNNAQLAENCWLYRGQIRGFRSMAAVATAVYADSQSIFRIPKDNNKPFDFTPAGSLWLEFPDPYMSVIRNPTVGDTFDRYYFFPSDQYTSTGANPSWPASSPGPVYNTLARLESGSPMYTLGIAAATVPPTVTPPATSLTNVTTGPTGVGATVLQFAGSSLGSVLVGMYAIDLTDHRLTANTTAGAAANTTVLTFSSTGTAPNNIVPGMTAICTNNPAAVFPNSTVVAVTGTTVTLSISFVLAINAGDTFQFDNVNQIIPNSTVTAVNNAAGQATVSAGIVSGGVQTGDTIQFLSAIPETRAYIYTYVSDYAEESQPSPATVASGDGTGTWVVVIPAPPAGYNTNAPFNPGHYRLYRTVTDTNGNATYYQVTEVPINPVGTVTVHDSASDASITANITLNTIGFAPPPAGLQGVVMMANGIAAGFTNEREVWFSAAYLPHAWPPQYALTVDYPIVGLTANGSSLNIICQGSPFIATGVTPDTMTIGKITANEPCISRGSIVSSGEGAYYASPNGVQQLNTGGTTNVTTGVYEKEFHYSLLPPQWASCRYGSSYATFIKGTPIPSLDDFAPADTPSPYDALGYFGFVMDSGDTNTPFTYLRFTAQIKNAYSDELSGQIFALMTDRTINQWNPPVSSSATVLRGWQWKTKKFRFTSPQQFKAFMVLYEVPPEVTVTLGVRNTDQAQTFDPTTQYLIIRVYADGQEVVVREIQKSGEVLTIPGGFKAELWEFQLEGQVGVRFFKVASSIKELKAA